MDVKVEEATKAGTRPFWLRGPEYFEKVSNELIGEVSREVRLQLQGGEKQTESKYFLQVESRGWVRELDVENEKVGGAKNEGLDSG